MKKLVFFKPEFLEVHPGFDSWAEAKKMEYLEDVTKYAKRRVQGYVDLKPENIEQAKKEAE